MLEVCEKVIDYCFKVGLCIWIIGFKGKSFCGVFDGLFYEDSCMLNVDVVLFFVIVV